MMSAHIPYVYAVDSSIYFYECDDPKRLLHTNESLPLTMRYLENRPHILQDYQIKPSLPYMNHKGHTKWDDLLPLAKQWTETLYNLTPETNPYKIPMHLDPPWQPPWHQTAEYLGLYRVR